MALIEDLMNTDLGKLLNQGDALAKILNRRRGDSNTDDKSMSTPSTDILSTPKEYIFYIDVPGLAKSDIQVQLEDESVLVIRGNGKRKREDGEEEGCKYLKLERTAVQKMMRKFRLPQDADAASISAKCENGVLTVIVPKVPPSKPKTVAVSIS